MIAFIPARGGSKGIAGKNLADLCGKPLVAHSILAALQCPLITRVVVTTDSEEIAEVSRRWGAETPFLRPAELAHDTASIGDAIAHSLETLRLQEGYVPEACITLYPTHPFRTRKLMHELTSMLLAGYRHVRTVRRIIADDFSHFVAGPGKGVRPMANRGDLPGGVFLRNYGIFVGDRCLDPCMKEHYLHQLQTEAELLDIDEPQHLIRANELMVNWDPKE
ncbi:MAG: acylneuraminate cytidylyltransferase family protein [Proteobacteria bacterium]|nr:acylneuraminate cytidylyltransferase family protein [Pseudomonadota bacterium]